MSMMAIRAYWQIGLLLGGGLALVLLSDKPVIAGPVAVVWLAGYWLVARKRGGSDKSEWLNLAGRVLENMRGVAVVVSDAGGRVLAANSTFCSLTGYDKDELQGELCHLFRLIEQKTETGNAIRASLDAQDFWRGEFPGRSKNGASFPGWGSLSVIRDAGGCVVHHVLMFGDFSSHKEEACRLQFLAQRDALTLLYNRSALQEKLAEVLLRTTPRNQRVALFFIDLDRFKTINDSLGHEIGDELLQVVALRLGCCVNERDYIARFGGDEFTVLIEDAPSDEVLAAIAVRINNEIARACQVRDQELFVTCSIGISRSPDDASDPVALVRMADMAMYRAKDQGKNTYLFQAGDMSAQASQRNLLEGHLRTALMRNQFILHYQPQYELAGEDFHGVEALIRWLHPELGMVPPASFIALAEEAGLIDAIGTWVIQESCRQMRVWLDQGLDLRQISVNLSPSQFRRDRLVETVQNALDEVGLEPQRLTLEITESIIMQNPDEARDILSELREMGVRVAIDDFGSGYSSLAYLRLFPLDTLKIDRAFITPLPGDGDSCAIAEAIVVMARALGLSVVAEGVETSEQASFLRSIGCDNAQGYLYSRPLPAEQLPEAFHSRASLADL